MTKISQETQIGKQPEKRDTSLRIQMARTDTDLVLKETHQEDTVEMILGHQRETITTETDENPEVHHMTKTDLTIETDLMIGTDHMTEIDHTTETGLMTETGHETDQDTGQIQEIIAQEIHHHHETIVHLHVIITMARTDTTAQSQKDRIKNNPSKKTSVNNVKST